MKPEDRQLLLHLGHHKTGTTAVQRALYSSKNRLSKAGILYPGATWVRHNHRGHFIDILNRERSNLVLKMGGPHKARRAAHQEWQRLYQELQAGSLDRVIMSCEGLLGNLIHADRQAFNDRLAQVTRRPVRALAYVREPSSHFLSQLQQRLKGGRGMQAPKATRWLRSIAFCRQDLGFELDLRVYERRQLVNSDIVADFWERARLDQAWLAAPAIEANVSLSSEAMAVLQTLGRVAPATTKAQLYRQRQLAVVVKTFDGALAGPSRPVLRAEWKEYITRINSEFLTLRDEFGLFYSDLDYELMGQGPQRSVPRMERVEDLCDVDEARRAELEERVQKEMASRGKTRPRIFDFLSRLRQP